MDAERANQALRAALSLEQSGQTAQALGQYEAALAAGADATGIHERVFGLLGFSLGASFEANTALFEGRLLPAMREAVSRGHFDQVVELEALAYRAYIKQRETEEHYEHCYRLMGPMLEQAGARLKAPAPLALPAPGGTPPRIGFFFHNAAMLAHTEVVMNYLEGLRQLDPLPVVPVVYVFQGPPDGRNPEFDQAMQERGASVHYLGDARATSRERFLALRKLAQAHRLSAIVWVSAPLYLGQASAMGVAPLHLWWALRFHPNAFPHVDGRIGGGSLFNERDEINGQVWRSAFMAFRDVYDPAQTPVAQALRARGGGKFVLGVVARPEKLVTPDYLRAVTTILRANPNAVFLYTSNADGAKHPPLEQALAAAGVAPQCFCVGWVDSKLYAQVFDVFLDSFPLACGVTAVQAMAAGTPVVSLSPREVSLLGAYAVPFVRGEEGTPAQQEAIRAIFRAPDGRHSYLACANTVDQYIAIAQRLIDDAAFRKATGAAQRRFTATYLADQKGLAARVSRHFRDIIAERMPGGSREGAQV